MFEKVFDLVMDLEGGLVLHTNPTESAETYAGIYKAAHPKWIGWVYLDEGETPPKQFVVDFYKEEFWDKISLDDSMIKALVFEYGVNAGISKAIKLLQTVVGAKVDGDIGPKTIEKIKAMDEGIIIDLYSLARIENYLNLANSNSRKYGLYLRGWLNRVFSANRWLKDNLS